MNELDVLVESVDVVLVHLRDLAEEGQIGEVRALFALRRTALLEALRISLIGGETCHVDSRNGKLIEALQLKHSRIGTTQIRLWRRQ